VHSGRREAWLGRATSSARSHACVIDGAHSDAPSTKLSAREHRIAMLPQGYHSTCGLKAEGRPEKTWRMCAEGGGRSEGWEYFIRQASYQVLTQPIDLRTKVVGRARIAV
jgi:hypothetical protein